ncbi:MAG TPA: VWA domain-containing protein [Chitinophagaceae bacterium]|nr:VWA domain-containing protein [Chitinophagaceae bacterium]
MNLQFQYKEFIWLLAAVPFFILLFIYLLRWKKRTRKKMGDARLVRLLTGNYSPALFTTKFIVLSTGFALGVVALMNPRVPGSADKLTRKGIDVVVALDVSKSMLANDLPPNRIERAKQFITKLMNAMPDDRIGLVLFAGKAYLQMPLTADHGAAQLYVSSASPDAVPQQGTVISDALNMSVKAFNPRERRFRSIVLISDGEDHDAEAVNTAEELAQQGVMINTIGVGSAEGSFIIDPATGQNKVDATGVTVITRLNESTLQQVAEKTNGVYLHLESSDETVTELKKQLSQIESKAYGDISLLNYKTFYMWFAGAMFVLLLAENFIPERKKEAP